MDDMNIDYDKQIEQLEKEKTDLKAELKKQIKIRDAKIKESRLKKQIQEDKNKAHDYDLIVTWLHKRTWNTTNADGTTYSEQLYKSMIQDIGESLSIKQN